jgi:hypothetical protein
MALLTLQSMTSAGLAPTMVAATGGGDTVALASATDDRSFLQVTNGGGSPITVTLADPGVTPAGNAGTATAQSVAAGATKLFPLNPNLVNTSTGFISISYSGVTTVTVAAIRR